MHLGTVAAIAGEMKLQVSTHTQKEQSVTRAKAN